jgi:hypothetical protein
VTLSITATRRLEALKVLAAGKPFLEIALPFRLESRANDHRSNHWGPRAATSKAQRGGAHLRLLNRRERLRKMLDSPGLVVRVVRIGPKELDSHDNLGSATKAVVDGVADLLGVNDRDPRVIFQPDAEKGPWGARVEFYEACR